MLTVDLSTTTTFRSYPGQIHYLTLSETQLSHTLIESLCILYTLILLSISAVWLKGRGLYLFWLLKAALLIATNIVGLQHSILADL